MNGVPSPVRLACPTAWTAAAVQSVLEALPWLAGRGAGLAAPRLRQLVKDRVALLALLRWLAEGHLAYQVSGTPLAQLGREPVQVQGRRLYAFTTLIPQRALIQRLRRRPEQGLSAEVWATVPEGRWQGIEAQPEDILTFGLVLALVAHALSESQRAVERGLPVRLLFLLPLGWLPGRHPQSLTLKYEGPGTLPLTLHGQSEGDLSAYALSLAAGQRLTPSPRWLELYALSTERLPQGRVGLLRPGTAPPLVIRPTQWANLWLYGMEVWWLGYLPRRAFAQQARRLPAGSLKGLGVRLGQAAYGVPLSALRPMGDLAARLIGEG